jgi:membrane protein YqaA with SNARE-associated domain
MSRVLSPLSYRATLWKVPVRQASSAAGAGIIRAMHFVIGSGILGLGKSVSSFGQTLALVLTFFVVLGGVVNVLIGYIVGQVMVERKQNVARRQAYDAARQQ